RRHRRHRAGAGSRAGGLVALAQLVRARWTLPAAAELPQLAVPRGPEWARVAAGLLLARGAVDARAGSGAAPALRRGRPAPGLHARPALPAEPDRRGEDRAACTPRCVPAGPRAAHLR